MVDPDEQGAWTMVTKINNLIEERDAAEADLRATEQLATDERERRLAAEAELAKYGDMDDHYLRLQNECEEALQRAEAAEAEAEVQKRLYEASVKDRVRLREALTDFAEHGTRFDCNPTVMVHNTPEWVASQEWWQNRATQMDVAVRNRARAALGEES